MKRPSIIFLLTGSIILCAIGASLGQSGLFVFKDSSKHELTVNAISDKHIFFKDKGSRNISEIAAVTFHNLKSHHATTVQRLRNHGVVVRMDNANIESMVNSVDPVDKVIEASRDDIPIKLHKFERDRSGAKALQLIGILGLGMHFYLQHDYTQKLKSGSKDANEPPWILPVAACGVIAIGIGIDIGAGGKLKLLKR